jgi:hypothetical protein
MSAVDIEKGSRWLSDVSGQLQECRVGVICLTPENVRAPWLLFEAGALSKAVSQSFVCPYLLEIAPETVTGPLAQFQCTRANREDTHRLVRTINSALGETALSDDSIRASKYGGRN